MQAIPDDIRSRVGKQRMQRIGSGIERVPVRVVEMRVGICRVVACLNQPSGAELGGLAKVSGIEILSHRKMHAGQE